ncbi:bifunctional metallophosphatase/5'-nucleotidase [Oceanobacillus sp. CAU 1775]
MEENIYLYFTNDLHSDFEQWPRTAGYLKKVKNRRERRQDAHFLLDSGDHMDRVDIVSEAFMGKGNIELMNDVGYDVVTIGNNEGITLAHDDLYELYDQANFSVVVSNLKHMENNPPDWLLESAIKETSSGVRIGFLGVTAPFNAFYELLGWDLTIPQDELEKQIQLLKKQVDVIVLLSHLGINEDQALARNFSDIDVIVGGHTHHLLRTGEVVNNTIITAAGKHCMHVGEVIITWDHEEKKLVKKEAYVTDISGAEKDKCALKLVESLRDAAESKLKDTVTHLEKPLAVNWYEQNEITQKLTDTLKSWTNADFALLNAGLLLEDFPKGDVSYADVHRICPHPINPVVVELRGDELIEVARASFKSDFMELQLKGFGFRGEVIGRMHFSGLDVKTKIQSDGNEQVTSVTTSNGETINRDKTYRIATADKFTFGRLLPEIARSEYKHYFLPEFIRDVLVKALKDKTN